MLASLFRRPAVLPRTAVCLIAITLAGQVAALFDAELRTKVLGISLLALDGLGMVYSLIAARRDPSARLTWRIAAAGRGMSLACTTAFSVGILAGSELFWWIGTTCGLSMFVLLSFSALSVANRSFGGRQRLAFAAELVTVLASGFVIVWYFVLDPALSTTPTPRWLFEIGYPLGNLLLLVMVSAVLLRGTALRVAQPVTVLLAGILLYAVGDIAFSAVRVQGQQNTNAALPCAALVLASLLMTVAAMQRNARVERRADASRQMPAWSAHLPYLAVGIGSVLLLVVTIREHEFLLWGGLSIGSTVMTAALTVRQLISLQDSRRLNEFDALTGLANIAGLQKAVDRAVERTGARREPAALMLVDLDGFKQVNDRHGHAVGDRLLTEFAALTREVIRKADTAARVGGDEFVVLLPGLSTAAQVIAVADRLLALLSERPLDVDGESITIRASIGLAVSDGTLSAHDLKRRADQAMYESKRSGSHGWRIFDEAMAAGQDREELLTAGILGAQAAGELEVLFQPLLDLTTDRPVGVESLLRWNHPTLGAVPPAEFIPVAERAGAMSEIGLWVLEETCRRLAGWSATGLYGSVNVSARQLRADGFAEEALAVIAHHGVDPSAIVLEILESAVADDSGIVIPTLETLRAAGVRIAIDDFGTGHSSLLHLTQLPVDVLKIDRSFVARLDGTTRGAAVAEAVIRLGQVLGLATVAEGVESSAQAAELQMMGCSVAQGYLFAEPLPPAALLAWVADRTARPSITTSGRG